MVRPQSADRVSGMKRLTSGKVAIAVALGTGIAVALLSLPAASDGTPVTQSPAARAALEDGSISDQEMEAALEDYAACLEEKGYTVISLELIQSRGWRLNVSEEGPLVDQAISECESIHVLPIAVEYLDSEDTETAWAKRQRKIAACMESYGIGENLPADADVLEKLDAKWFIRCDFLLSGQTAVRILDD